LLLSGPLPTLNQIEVNPDLIQVTIDASGLSSGQSASLPPTIIAPDGIQAQSIPPKLLVRLAESSNRFSRGKENE
jgi:hypothetical protein